MDFKYCLIDYYDFPLTDGLKQQDTFGLVQGYERNISGIFQEEEAEHLQDIFFWYEFDEKVTMEFLEG